MSENDRNPTSLRLNIITIATVMLGFGVIASGVQAAPGSTQPAAEPLILAATDGMDRRQDRREDRGDDRKDRKGDRRDCRDEEGVVGKDKRDCKQEERQDRRSD